MSGSYSVVSGGVVVVYIHGPCPSAVRQVVAVGGGVGPGGVLPVRHHRVRPHAQYVRPG